jgi:hypothetical protein
MTGLPIIIHRLKMGQAKRLIHRDLGVHHSIITDLYEMSYDRLDLTNILN